MASLSRANGVPSDQPQGAYYTVDIAQAAFSSATGDNTGGGVSPKTQGDFATPATSLVLSQRSNRAQIRYKKMLDMLQVRSNVRIINLVTTGDSNGSTQITDLNFGLVYENDDYIPNFGTAPDGSTTSTTKVMWIADQIATALNSTFKENCLVYDPSTTSEGAVKGVSTQEITAEAVHTMPGEILEAITVTEVSGFRSNVDAETPTDNAASWTAE